MAKFEEKESFLHKYAKDLVYQWLKENENGNDYCSLNPIAWRSNYGIFKELKFYETSDPYYFELSGGLYENRNMGHRPQDNDSWFSPSFNRGKILFVPDITIFHKGTATILVEVVHTHPLSDKKLKDITDFFKGHWLQIFEIRAIDIMHMTSKPTDLPILRLTEL